MSNTIILKSDTFKYPTKDERKEIGKLLPKMSRFIIQYKAATIQILQNSIIENAIRNEDIYWWNNCLNNRLGKVIETYVYVIAHFQRHKKNSLVNLENSYTDKLLLDYYVEIFYYYFFSARDVLGQVINLVCNLGFEEHRIFLNEQFIKKIQSDKIKQVLSNFSKETQDSYNIRNSFNHRFTPTNIDLRAKKNIIQECNKISFYSAQEVKIETFIKDIENLMKQFSQLMNELDEEIKHCC